MFRIFRLGCFVFVLLCFNSYLLAEEESGGAFEQKEDTLGFEKKEGPSSGDWEKLIEKINELDEEVKRLRESAEIRKKLELTDDETKAAEREVLSAAGRVYVLAREGTLELEYNGRYDYTSSDRLDIPLEIKHRNNHTFRHTFVAEYALWNNFSVHMNVPFVYKYDKTGSEASRDENDLGNVSIGCQWQPFKTGSVWPTSIFFFSYSFDTGKSPYEINPGQELSTADGYDSLTAGVSLSKTIDPVVAFGSLSYSYNNDVTGIHQNYGGDILKKVEPGNDISFSMGFGYALSYNVSMNMQYQHTYRLKSRNHWQGMGTQETSTTTSSMLNIGTGWRVNRKTSVDVTLGVGLTDDAPDFAISIRLPFTFVL